MVLCDVQVDPEGIYFEYLFILSINVYLHSQNMGSWFSHELNSDGEVWTECKYGIVTVSAEKRPPQSITNLFHTHSYSATLFNLNIRLTLSILQYHHRRLLGMAKLINKTIKLYEKSGDQVSSSLRPSHAFVHRYDDSPSHNPADKKNIDSS